MRNSIPFVSAPQAQEAGYAALSAVQHLTPAEQVAGVWYLAYLIAQQRGLDPSDLMNQSQRRADKAKETHLAEFQAFTDYINKELR